MLRLKPYFSDVAAFALLGLAVATVVGVVTMKSQTEQASLYQSVTTDVTSL